MAYSLALWILTALMWTVGELQGQYAIKQVAIIPALLAIAAAWFAPRSAQKRRDARAAETLKEALSLVDPSSPDSSQTVSHAFVLYLRPFDSDGKISVRVFQPITLFLGPFSLFVPDAYNLERQLLAATTDCGDFLSFGLRAKGASRGGRIIASEEDWKGKLAALGKHCSLFICVPSATTGTLWELEWIKKNGKQHKTVLLFTHLHESRRRPQYHIAGLQVAMRDIGWEIPDGIMNGSLVLYDALGRPRVHKHSSGFKRRHLASAFQSAIVGRMLKPVSSMGSCPNCGALISISARECPNCLAFFGAGSAWRVRPRDFTE